MVDRHVREDMACLVDSPYRGQLLICLREGVGRRIDLRESVDASRATISRALSAFEDREWVVRTGQTYELTHLGRLVADAFESFETTMTTADELRGVIEFLPVEKLGFDIEQLRGVNIVRSTPSDPMAPLRHNEELIRRVDALSILSHAFSPGSIHALRQRTEAEQSTEIIITDSVTETVFDDPSLRSALREAVAAEMLDIWEYEGEIPWVLATADERASFGVQDGGRIVATIDTDNEIVHEWVRKTIAEYREAATLVSVDRLR